MREQELIRRADLALSDLSTNGGLMNAEQANRFLRKLIDQPTILNEARTVRMARPQMEINKIGFTSRILKAANQGAIGEPGAADRALAAADRSSPITEKLTLNTSEVIAEIDLPYEVIEDNIEGGGIDGTQFEETILDLIAERAATDLEELLITGDTGDGDPYIALQDGIIKLAVSNIVNQNSAVIDPDMFANMIKSLPTKYHRLLGQMKFYLQTTKEIDYRMQVAQRQTTLGDATLQGTAPVSVLGVGMSSAALMPAVNAILTVPRNIIWGVQRSFRMEFDRIVRERVFVIVLTMRVAIEIEEEDMVVKAINIG